MRLASPLKIEHVVDHLKCHANAVAEGHQLSAQVIGKTAGAGTGVQGPAEQRRRLAIDDAEVVAARGVEATAVFELEGLSLGHFLHSGEGVVINVNRRHPSDAP